MLSTLLLWSATASAGSLPADIERLAGPCAQAGTQWWCWGDIGGGLSLEHVPALDGLTDLTPVRDGVCGLADGALTCVGGTQMAQTDRIKQVALLSQEGVGHCALDRQGKGTCVFDAVDTGRAMTSLMWVDTGWVGVTLDGTVAATPEVTLGPLSDLTDVVQLASTDHVSCARTRAGKVACVRTDPVVNALPDALLHSGGGVTDAIDVAVGPRTLCVLHATGRVGCATTDPERYPLPGRPPSAHEALVDLGLTGIRDIQLVHDQLCVAEARQVRCNRLGGLTGFLNTPVPVPDLPPVVHVAMRDSGGCGVGRDGGLWCWGELPDGPSGNTRRHQPPTRLADHAVDVVSTHRHYIWLDREGTVHRLLGSEEPKPFALWPGDTTGVTLSIHHFWVQENGWDYDILCAQRAPEARCVALHSRDGSRARSLPDLTDVRQAIPADPLFVLGTDGTLRALGRDLKSWLPTEAWKPGVPANILLAHTEGHAILIDRAGTELHCYREDGPPRHIACSPDRTNLSGLTAFATTWDLDTQGTLTRTYPDEPTHLLDAVSEARSRGGYGIMAVTKDGRAWSLDIPMDNGTTWKTGLWGRWTTLTPE